MNGDAIPQAAELELDDSTTRTARPVPLAVWDCHDGENVQVLYAREIHGGNKGQLPLKVELVLVEHPKHDVQIRRHADEKLAPARSWHDLELEAGREVMARPYAMVRVATMKPA